MKKVIAIIILSLLSILSYSQTTTEWSQVGESLPYNADNISTMTIYNESPCVAYTTGDNSSLVVSIYDGKSWNKYGFDPKLSSLLKNDDWPSLIVSNGNLYVAFRHTDWNGMGGKQTYGICVLQLVGNQFEILGDTKYLTKNSIESLSKSLAVSTNNNQLFVAYATQNTGKITVKKWDGKVWSTVGNVGFGETPMQGTTCDTLSLDFVGSTPYISYNVYINVSSTQCRNKGFVEKLDGNRWVGVGSSNGMIPLNEPSDIQLVVNNSTPYILCTNSLGYGNGWQYCVMKFNGTDWKSVGNLTIPSPVGNRGYLTFYKNSPVAAFQTTYDTTYITYLNL